MRAIFCCKELLKANADVCIINYNKYNIVINTSLIMDSNK